eukprot:CAMPEP_0197438564 /NCGR_PEP_ID=MMETSP1175-20131217/5519_1 /TAXON_ID=1003142 /ORGANISM="Triceratium dubium, Strain CCMP147" /LENGTH=1029 /DNA_ID=CAMNT_0042968315 /DNA_START=540 /DNA_END=3629 /DNA_ORIENTATION=-
MGTCRQSTNVSRRAARLAEADSQRKQSKCGEARVSSKKAGAGTKLRSFSRTGSAGVGGCSSAAAAPGTFHPSLGSGATDLPMDFCGGGGGAFLFGHGARSSASVAPFRFSSSAAAATPDGRSASAVSDVAPSQSGVDDGGRLRTRSPPDAYAESLPRIVRLNDAAVSSYRSGDATSARAALEEARSLHVRADAESAERRRRHRMWLEKYEAAARAAGSAATATRAEAFEPSASFGASDEEPQSFGAAHGVFFHPAEASSAAGTKPRHKRRKGHGTTTMIRGLVQRLGGSGHCRSRNEGDAASVGTARPEEAAPTAEVAEAKESVVEEDGMEASLKPWTSSSSESSATSSTYPDAGEAVPEPPRTSYIYQRMDFDEGMHAFADVYLMPQFDEPTEEELHDDGDDSSADLLIGTKTRVLATLMFNLGQCHRRCGDMDSANKYYLGARQALDSEERRAKFECGTLGAEQAPPILAIAVLHNIGQIQYRRGQLRDSIETYKVALAKAERIAMLEKAGAAKSEDVMGDVVSDSAAATVTGRALVASTLNCLGVLHYHASSSASDESTSSVAMDHFDRALDLRKTVLGPRHEDVATVLNNIGRVHVQKDRFDDALEYYEEALSIRRERLGRDSLDYAATAFNAGQSLHQRGELDRALELYREFLRVAQLRFAGTDHRDVAVVLSGIAQIHQERGEHAEALALYERSLKAGRAALGEYHSEVAMLLNRIGNFHFERDDLDAALRCYQEGLEIERRVLDADHPNIVVTLSNLGEIHRQRSEWNDAFKMYTEALELQRRRLGENHPDVASTLNTLGLIHDQKGDSCAALKCLQDALLLRRAALGNDHLDVSATLTYVGTILYRRNVLGVAMDLFSESLRIRRASLGPDHRDVAFTLYNIALVHQQRGSYEEAIECYRETLRVERLVLGDRHRDVAMTLYKLGEVYKAHGDMEGALERFTEALDIERETLGEDDPATLARTLNEIGNIQLARGEVIPMMEAFNEAARIYRRAGLSPNNLIVSGQLYAFDISCPEAAPAA